MRIMTLVILHCKDEGPVKTCDKQISKNKRNIRKSKQPGMSEFFSDQESQ